MTILGLIEKSLGGRKIYENKKDVSSFIALVNVLIRYHLSTADGDEGEMRHHSSKVGVDTFHLFICSNIMHAQTLGVVVCDSVLL